MFSKLLTKNSDLSPEIPAEGELYKVIDLHGRAFKILYGYYEERERLDPTIDPMPIYPDFLAEPQYTPDGYPFVTMMQDACAGYSGEAGQYTDCSACEHYRHGDDLLGICTNVEKRRSEGGTNEKNEAL